MEEEKLRRVRDRATAMLEVMESREQQRKWSSRTAVVFSALAAGSSMVGAASTLWLSSGERPPLETRIEELSNSLRDATNVIGEIEFEITERRELVAELERKARIAEQLQAANREQVEAISLLLRSELEKEKNWDFWINVLQNALFMTLGAFLGHFVERWMSRRGTQREKPA